MLLYVLLGISLATAGLITALSGWWHSAADLWLVPALFVGCFLALLLCLALFLLVAAACIGRKRKPRPGNTWYYRLVVRMVRLIHQLVRVKIHLSGESLPRDRRFLLVSNHRSMFDPLVCLDCFRDTPVAYISKPENFKIPVVGPFVRMCGFMAIDRENPRNAIRTIQQAAAMITADQMSVGVYPEGTRSKTGELLPFHNGVMKIAQKSHAPIAVVTVTGTQNVAKRAPWRHTDVYVRVAAVLEPETFAGQSSAELADRVRSIMEASLAAENAR